MRRKPTTGPVHIRVWQYIELRDPDDCWLWTASLAPNGYGQISDGARTRKAHQVVLEIKIGRPLATHEGEKALHTCDVRRCCNPGHLYVGTQADNMRDMVSRGRARFGVANGTKNPNAKLTEAQVLAILAVLAADPPPGTKSALARLYGVSPSRIGEIERGDRWRHVTAPDLEADP